MINIFKKLLGLFKSNKNINNKQSESDYNGKVSFLYTDSGSVNIEFILPSISEDNEGSHNEEDLIKKSEFYAQMLVLISRGAYKETIVRGLKHMINNNNNINDKLLASNILSFYLVLDKSSAAYEESRKNQDDFPSIRPTEVFKISQ